jgi:hypothetical protein
MGKTCSMHEIRNYNLKLKDHMGNWHRREDNIRMYKNIWYEGVDMIQLT